MKAALLTKLNAPLEVMDCEPCSLNYGQVLVKMLVSGICGAQLQEISGQKGGPLPHPLGHEGCGIVQEIGLGVKHVKVGDKVVCHWRVGSGIDSDFPRYELYPSYPRVVSGEIPKIITGGKVTTFSEYSICSENRLTSVPMATPPELCALLGCGLSTALATLENEARLLRGESILIVGCGGLGVNLIAAARMTGAWPIVVADIAPKHHIALDVGATQFWNFNEPVPFTKQSFNVIIDTSGNKHAIAETLPLLAPSGRYIMVGQPKPGEILEFKNAFHFFEGSGKTLKATQGGGYRPEVDCPRYANFFANCTGVQMSNGSMFVSHRFPLADINEGLDEVRKGNASRVMIHME